MADAAVGDNQEFIAISALSTLQTAVDTKLSALIQHSQIAYGEFTIQVAAEHLHSVCLQLRDDVDFQFSMLMDVCGVDYLHYGIGEWETESATATGFERGVEPILPAMERREGRFGVVYHLLSLEKNHRIRIRVLLDEHDLKVSSVIDIWPAANWFEREAFDLFGIMFAGHSDLRRLLTDYGFIGHPFRKDFPLSGNVEVRYDAALRQVIYVPVSITPRILEPKVIRDDNRYRVEE